MHSGPVDAGALRACGAARRGRGRRRAAASRVSTGAFTGRTPRDKYIVEEPGTKETVWWGNINQPVAPERFESLRQRMLAYLQGHELFVQDLYAGADPTYRLPVRVITDTAWHSLFARNMFVRPPADELAGFEPAFTIVHAPNFLAIPEFDRINSETFIFVNFAERLVLIGGTAYAGEIKKSVFGYLNFVLPARDVLPMHASANVGPMGDCAIFFGLSGTGKTTLSADSSRTLIGDDEHGWGPKGIFNFEGGCYRQSDQSVPDRGAGDLCHAGPVRDGARKRHARSGDAEARCRRSEPDREYAGLLSARFHPQRRPARGRAASIERRDADRGCVRGHAADRQTDRRAGDVPLSVGLHSTCRRHRKRARQRSRGDLFDLLRCAVHAPPSIRLRRDAGRAHQGARRGVLARQHRLVWRHLWRRQAHADRLYAALLRAALDGRLADAPVRREPNFGLLVPEGCPDVPSEVLDPRGTWSDKDAYDDTARELTHRFEANFKEFEPFVGDEVKEIAVRGAV